jgi:type II secretory pathway component PulF
MLLDLNNGIRIQDSLETSKDVVKNYVLKSIIESSINDIIVGHSWVESFEKSGLASPMIIEMLNIGMTTDLREMMSKLLEYLQTDIDNTLAKIMKTLPEIVTLIVGVALIFLVVVVLVPVIDVYMGGWLFDLVDV